MLAETSASDVASLLVWLVVLVILVIAGLALALQVKRRLAEDDETQAAAGFTLADLRDLHRNGQMSDEEFEKAKVKIVEASRAAAAREVQRGTGGKTPQGPRA